MLLAIASLPTALIDISIGLYVATKFVVPSKLVFVIEIYS